MNFSERDFPGLFQAADKAAKEAQHHYFTTLAGNSLILICGAATGLIQPQTAQLAIVQALLFLAALGLSLLLAFSKFQNIWYNGRAVAESVKTRTWRFIANADPFGPELPPTQAKALFLNDIKQILDQNTQLSGHLAGDPANIQAITPAMLEARALSLNDRIELYRINRLDDQWAWYGKKALTNRRSAHKWFVLLILFQGIAVCCSIAKIQAPISTIFPTDMFAVAAGCVLSWLQAKRYQELSASYSLAAHEIGIVRCSLDDINSDKAFSDFVIGSEMAFSREHTQWHARQSS